MRKTGRPLNSIIAENMKLVKSMKVDDDKNYFSSGLPDDMTDEEIEKVKEEIRKMKGK